MNLSLRLKYFHLKDSEHCDWKWVEVWGWSAKVKVEGAPEQLHAEEGEDEDEEEEEEEEGHDGLHGGEQGDHKVPQGGPVSWDKGGEMYKNYAEICIPLIFLPGVIITHMFKTSSEFDAFSEQM